MSYITTDAFGEDAYLDGALARLETGQPLRDVDMAELGTSARDLLLRLEKARQYDEAKRKGRAAPRPVGGFWGWLGADPIHQQPELPVTLARLIRNVQQGRLIDESDLRWVGRRIGRAATRGLQRQVMRGGAEIARAVRGRGRVPRGGRAR